ncbi:protein RBL-like [Chenopodium quinoa]|uniref:Anaphase-promoting complex subunit 4-like WD40 domain-containing protein n=1 Tax=Chenopodium quinoa TaxID=63459 RepID=A0A803KQL4_CHEQI|nr:protein RBL-like [Chenopodium quinoa]XP_021720277.1 protein RBL-like [Chenopodium quinoa]XP_021720278.1 protein RBL-like [Chenopodium quinoa]XP_021720279.1 protein RBL-like [Chenopodium quinoa]
MNNPIIDPLQGDFPEVIEEYLEHGVMKCIAFNRRGTLLAAGCSNGSCVIWDFETRGIAKELQDKDCNAAITSVSWSKYGHRILASSANRTLILWDVATGEKVAQTALEKAPLQARLYPGSSTPSMCLVCPVYSPPLIIEMKAGTITALPASVSDGGDGLSVPSRNKVFDETTPHIPACFNKHGDLVYLGNSKGEILVVDHDKAQVRALIPPAVGAVIKNIVFSRNGQYLLTNSSDRIIRVYENMLPTKDGLKALDEMDETLNDLGWVEKLKAIGSKSLVLYREFQDSVTRIHWKVPGFSGDGEWVIGGSASKGEHKIYIWDRAGHLVKFLEGPKEALIDLAWHPVHPIVVSVSFSGSIFIWAKDYTENWSAFAPDFKELEENEEYVEREDEFDIMPETEKVKDSEANQEEEVDIITVEHDSTFSDSDLSQEELCFLPATPCPDAPEQQDISVGNSLKLVENNHSVSPLSADAALNGLAMNHESGHVEGIDNSPAEDTSGRLKRKRKPSEKVLESQAEMVKKPVKKAKPSAKALKPKDKVVDEDNGLSVSVDEVSDDYYR